MKNGVNENYELWTGVWHIPCETCVLDHAKVGVNDGVNLGVNMKCE